MQRLAVLLLAVLTAGCACTAIGCYNQVRFLTSADLQNDTTYSVTACFDEQCENADLTPTETSLGGHDSLMLHVEEDVLEMVLSEGDLSGSHRVTLLIATDDGTEVARFDGQLEMLRVEPNGGWPCGPTCWQAQVEV
jgi:hypothetical protein